MDMTANTDCTIIRLTDDGAASTYVPEAMWQDVYAAEVKKYGPERADNAAVYIPDVDTDIRTGDFIVRGTVTEDDLRTACRSALKVTSVAVNRYGSPDMHHIKAGAKMG